MYAFAHMKLDEDTREGNSQALSDKGLGLYVEVEEKTSYVVPEILTLDVATLEKYYGENPELKLYKKRIDTSLYGCACSCDNRWGNYW